MKNKLATMIGILGLVAYMAIPALAATYWGSKSYLNTSITACFTEGQTVHLNFKVRTSSPSRVTALYGKWGGSYNYKPSGAPDHITTFSVPSGLNLQPGVYFNIDTGDQSVWGWTDWPTNTVHSYVRPGGDQGTPTIEKVSPFQTCALGGGIG